jgi:peptidoglycan/LPS O-acetylase OafA/YrhL
MVRNIWPTKLGPGFWYTSHFWSLAVEEHFYLLLPGFLFLFRRHRLAVLSATAIILEIWRMIVLKTPPLQHALGWQLAQRTDMAIDGILLGCIFAVALTYKALLQIAVRWLRPWLALLFAVIVLFELGRHRSEAVQSSILLIYPLLIVATVLHSDSYIGRFLELKPLRFIGRISYSLYLWQQLFFNPEETVTTHSLHAHVLLCWCATFACALASYYLIETPLIRRGHQIASRFDLHRTPVKHHRGRVASDRWLATDFTL